MNTEKAKKNERLMSLDALRGFDMFWITGGHLVIAALAGLTGWGVFNWLESQMHHAEWHGFMFYDLIFPLFLFISGVTWPFSLRKRRSGGRTMGSIHGHMIQRMLLLVFFGMIYNGLLKFDFEHMRYASVLARIGIAWFFAALIVTHTKPVWWHAFFAGILLSYWAMLALIPVPGHGAGDYSMEGSLVGHIDRLLLPGKLYKTVHDPEGILSTFPAIATALMGSITGNFLMKSDMKIPRIRKFYFMFLAGALVLLAGWAWGHVFPVNKNLWTSSFVLVAGGISLLFLAIFYLVIDIWEYRGWAFFFSVIGMNAITIYMLQAGIINFWDTTEFFFAGLTGKIGGEWGAFLMASGYVAVVWTFLYILYKKRIFLRV